MTALAISDNGRVLIPAARLHAEVRDGRLALTPASRRYANATRRYAALRGATRRYAALRAYFDSHLPPAEGRSVADEFIAERRAEAEAAHEASGGQPGT